MLSSHALSSITLPSSSSRKRTHAEITRSGSRLSSPEQPSKRRRRTLRSPSFSSPLTPSSSSPISFLDDAELSSPVSSSESSTPSPAVQGRRSLRDGFDLRRPVMTTRNDATQTIDLTADESSPPLSSRRTPPVIRPPSPNIQQPREREVLPPDGNMEVINLSDSDEPTHTAPVQPPGRHSTRVPPNFRSSSPEIEFLSERPAQQTAMNHPPGLPNPASVQPSRPPAADINRPTMREIISRGAQFVFNNLNPAAINLLASRPGNQRDIPEVALARQVIGLDDFDGIRLNYQQQAFEFGTRESEPPQIVAEPYKAPAPAIEGFTRDVQEEEILVCPYCGDELAAGEGDVKQQVWVVKQCGHVYCGDCATNRALTTNKREKKKTQKRINLPFKHCMVEGCEKSVQSRTAMFQIYL